MQDEECAESKTEGPYDGWMEYIYLFAIQFTVIQAVSNGESVC